MQDSGLLLLVRQLLLVRSVYNMQKRTASQQYVAMRSYASGGFFARHESAMPAARGGRSYGTSVVQHVSTRYTTKNTYSCRVKLRFFLNFTLQEYATSLCNSRQHYPSWSGMSIFVVGTRSHTRTYQTDRSRLCRLCSGSDFPQQSTCTRVSRFVPGPSFCPSWRRHFPNLQRFSHSFLTRSPCII